MRAIGTPRCYRVGDEWLTISEIANRCDMKPNAVRWRLNKGWDPIEAMKRPTYSGRARPGVQGGYYLNGEPVTQRRLAELAGISEGGMSKRLKIEGMTPEKAVAMGNRNPRKP